MSKNVAVRETQDGVAITLGRRDAHLGMSTLIDRDQAEELYAQLGYVLWGEGQYQDWLAKQAGLALSEPQLDQGAEIIPIGSWHGDEEGA